MTIWRIAPEEQEKFAGEPEVAMDLQIGRIGQQPIAVVGCRLAIAFDASLPGELEELSKSWPLCSRPSEEALSGCRIAGVSSFNLSPAQTSTTALRFPSTARLEAESR